MLLSFSSLVPVTLLLTVALSAPIPATIETRKASTVCNEVSYTAAEVTECTDAAYSHHKKGTKPPGSQFPQEFENLEKFTLAVKPPYEAFPLKKEGVYTGGDPGPDRCLISTTTGKYAGVITSSGAENDDSWVKCSRRSVHLLFGGNWVPHSP
ncbi:hypothetical protein LZ554_005483 [Drepanopeziza brunnea f. sp. 'monogermtubi']|nr:hypothetical protein LZ554_005483 [Drepanopeziza brunnea f. sp. 'monogermtubi']